MKRNMSDHHDALDNRCEGRSAMWGRRIALLLALAFVVSLS
jgi:hypothetical protein